MQVRFISVDQVEVRCLGKCNVLTHAVSASGERYINAKGFNSAATEWRQKGDEAVLTCSSKSGAQEEIACSLASAQ